MLPFEMNLILVFLITTVMMSHVLVRRLIHETHLYLKRRRDRRYGQFRNMAHADQHRQMMFARLNRLNLADRAIK